MAVTQTAAMTMIMTLTESAVIPSPEKDATDSDAGDNDDLLYDEACVDRPSLEYLERDLLVASEVFEGQ